MAIVILMGAPGAGKGTQSKKLAQKMNVPVISMGDILREKKNEDSPSGRELKEIMAGGGYVSDEIVNKVLEERVRKADCSSGFLLDGFPRTTGQAEALDVLLKKMGRGITRVIQLDVPESQLVERLAGRRICSNCKKEYHISFSPPQKNADICDVCGGKLIQRDDDQPQTIRKRLVVYLEQTKPLLGYYEKKGLLKTVLGTGPLDEVFNRMVEAV